MGRELKRVPLDFKYPVGKPENQPWEGYLNPYHYMHEQCPVCEGSGTGLEYLFLESLWYKHLNYRAHRMIQDGTITDERLLAFADKILKARMLSVMFFNWASHYGVNVECLEPLRGKFFKTKGALIDAVDDMYFKAHPMPDGSTTKKAMQAKLCIMVDETARVGWSQYLDEDDVKALADANRLFEHMYGKNTPTAEEVNLRTNTGGMGHDGINESVVVGGMMERLGYDRHGGGCKNCNGEGIVWESEEAKKKYEEWESYDPPEGHGYQLWQTTSEGSPVSPVFPSLEELCEWCAENASTFGSFRATKEQWMKMLNDNFVHHKDERGNIHI